MAEIPLVMPKMSMTMEDGVLLVWHKAEGDEICSGDVVCEVMTDKVDMEVESPVDGTLLRVVAQPEQTVAVGEPIAYLTTSADDLLGDLLSEPPGPQPDRPAPASEQATSALVAAPPDPTRVAAVPLARRRATELGVDLATLTGTGPGGTIRVPDVEAATRPTAQAIPTPIPTPAPHSRPTDTDTAPARRRPRTVVAHRADAGAAVPHAVVYRDLDLQALVTHRSTYRWAPVVIRAYAAALRDSPLNSRWTGEGSEVWSHVPVAVTVHTGRGPLAPVLADPDQLPIGELDKSLRRLADQARAGKVPLQHLAAATTTVYDLGDMGVDAFQELLTPPQATALAMGAVASQVVPGAAGVEIRTRCRVGLTIDHRAGDCLDAAHLLNAVQRRLDDPSWFGWH
ncbi:2-oxo acid dehydrogenase subunit E2 [Streptomyces oryzae]|uniref:Dihydrolipoamide acetyltransferase component of pyruvate dehydrogenase complex n=1 Tax=Streptomyces oryzae TaxID=1434886 RepID=A0ABS3X861_9ACTN|nr:2-oxo acid dehydrogenase subunit E2 [Streptomyces oryzae]MBO8191564.1 2-oxo acid dehydrogenase subunit E2 [Streptomyces oryzae]